MAIVAAAIAVVAAAAVLVASMLFFTIGRSFGIPRPVYLPFDSWHGSQKLSPPLTAEYEVRVEYERKEGGRLGEPLRIKLFDETVGKIVPIEGEAIFWEQKTVVGKCHLSEGHQYRIEVDAQQAKELGLHHHRLAIHFSSAELVEMTSDEPKPAQRPKTPKEWNPVELEKARAIRRAWEAAGRP